MPDPTPTVNVPAVTPTAGAILGGVIATAASPAIAAAVPFLPPVVTAPLITGFFTWLFHFAHSKLGTPE